MNPHNPGRRITPLDTRKTTIPNISCAHCAHTIKRELLELEGVEAVAVDVAGKMVTIRWEAPANWQVILDLLREIGYPPAP
jgi:copper chaperone CopZ